MILLIGSVGFLIYNNKSVEIITYNQVEDDSNIESSINSYLKDEDLIIKYTNPNNEKVWIEGLSPDRYLINKSKIIIYNYKDEFFKLHIGEESDIYTFGEREVDINYKNNNMTIEFKDGINTLGKVNLKSHKTYDEIRKVTTGKNKTVIWYEFSDFKDIQLDALGEVEFIDMREFIVNDSKEHNEFEELEIIENPNYLKPINKEYNFVYLSNEKWIDYNLKDIPKENIIIGVQTDLFWGEFIDIRLNVFENKLDKHAIVLGVSSGFVTSTPVDDPGGSSTVLDTSRTMVSGDTTTDAMTIIEMGWWRGDSALEDASFEVGIYEDDNGVPGDLLYFSSTSSTSSKLTWNVINGLSWPLLASTKYWLAIWVNETGTNIGPDVASSGGQGRDWSGGSAKFPNPYNGGALSDSDAMYSIYAVWSDEEADTTKPTYLNNQTNTTEAGESVLFSILYDDGIALNPNGQYIFSTNNSGVWANESTVNFTATPSWANVTKTLNSTEGISIGYRWYANDTAGNNNNTGIFTLIITDTTSPIITPPANATLEYLVDALDVDFSVNENIDTWSVNDTNNFTINSTGYLENNTALLIGTYIINISVNDSFNNTGFVIYEVVVQDTTPPIITPPANATLEYLIGEPLMVDFEADENIDTWSVNDTNNFTINSTGYLENNTLLLVGTYILNISANDTYNNTNFSIYQVIVQDTVTPIITPPANATLEYLEEDLGVDFEADESIDTWTVNDTTNFKINSTGYLENNTILLVGTYILNISANDSGGNTNFSIYEVVVQDTTPPIITPPANATDLGYLVDALGVDFSADETINTWIVNDTNNFTINSTGYLENNTFLLVGTYILNISANDSSSNAGFVIYEVIVKDLNSPIITPPSNATLEYLVDALDVDFSADETINTWSVNDTNNFTINSTGYLSNNTVLLVGTYVINISANDTYNNTGFVIYEVIVQDAVTPIITPPANATLEYLVDALDVDFSADEAIDTWVVNDTNNFTINSTGYLENNTILLVGTYVINISANDSNNNTGYVIYQVVVQDTTAPTITPPANATLEYLVDNLGVDFSTNENIDTWSVNDTNNFTINSTGYLENNTALLIGTYVINISANDSFNNTGFVIYEVIVSDTIKPIFTTIPANDSIIYPDDWAGVFFVATDSSGVDNFSINDSNFIINSTGFLDAPIIAVGNYYINISVNDTYNNTNFTIYNLNITQGIGSCNVLFNETSPIIYPETFLAWSNCTSAFTLYINGTIIVNNSVQSLGASSYNFSVVRTDQVNYSNTFDEVVFDVSKAAPLGSLSGTSPILYGTTGDIKGNETNIGDNDVMYKLYRDGDLVSNPDETVLDVGVHNYIYNTSGGANWSVDASLDTFALTVNQNIGNCEVFFNETSPQTYGVPFKVYSNCNSTFTLYRNGTIIANNSVQELAANTYNFSVVRTDQVNYSNTFDDEFFTINKATSGGHLYLNGTITNKTISRTQTLNITAILVNGTGTSYIYQNNSLLKSGDSPLTNITQFNTTGYFIINYTYLGNENYTAFEKDLYVTVGGNPLATINIVYPSDGGIYESNIIALNFSTTLALSCWYDLNNGSGSIAQDCGTNITGIISQDGINTWTIIAQNIDDVNTTTSVSFTIDLPIEYDNFTIEMMDVIKVLIMLSGLVILAFTFKSFYEGEISFGRLFRIGVVVGLAELFILLLAPVAIRYIADVIN